MFKLHSVVIQLILVAILSVPVINAKQEGAAKSGEQNKRIMKTNCELITFDDQDNLARAVANHMSKDLHIPQELRFADGEMRLSLKEPDVFTGKTVVLLQSTCHPVNDNIIRIAFLTHELKNAGAERVVAVLPYFGYSRQEKSDIPNKPGEAFVVAKILEGAGIDGIISVELHDPIVQTFFSIPVSNIMVHDEIAQHITRTVNVLQGVCFIAPDEGAAESVRAVADQFGAGVIVYKKERFAVNQTRVIGKVGTCINKIAILIDDIIDTGSTALDVCKKLKEDGFETIYGYFIHPVLSRNAVSRIEQGPIDHMFVSNTIRLPEEKSIPKIAVFDVSLAVTNAIEQMIQK